MPLLTPSRIVFALFSLLLFSFLWSSGLPDRGTTPIIVNHHPRPPVQLVPEPPSQPQPEPPVKADAPKGNDQSPTPTPTPSPTPDDNTAVADGGAPKPRPTATSPNTLCKDVRGAQDTMVIVKTSRADGDKLPPHLATLLACIPNVAIFSDYAGEIDGYPVHDALDTINKTSRERYDEFREYKKMQADKNYAPAAGSTTGLDKWKFLPMVYKTYKLQPSNRFYLFIEPDTSLSWTNLLQWLERPDYRIAYYSGAPMFSGTTRYAQRGASILLSYGAMRLYAKSYEERYATEWEPHVGSECCGDQILATAMKDAHVEFTSAFPLLQAEAPSTLDWTQRHWCTPIVSWQHKSSEEADRLWDAQQKWTHKHGWAAPYLTRHAFDEFALPNMVDRKDDWDNISSDTHIKAETGHRDKLAKEAEDKKKAEEKEAEDKEADERKITKESTAEPPPNNSTIDAGTVVRRNTDLNKMGATIKDAADSADNCQAICQKTEDCLQWKYTTKGDGECHLGKVIRLGRKPEKKDGETWTSGWILDRVKRVSSEWGQCEKPNWKFNQ